MDTQLSLVNGEVCADWASADTYSKRIKCAARFCAERHMIYIRKETNREPKPWTNDWILRANRFTNIYRELDRVTVEIMDNWIEPNLTNPNLAAVALVGRVINLPSTLIALHEAGLDFSGSRAPNPKKVFAVLDSIRKKKVPVVTGAYIVNTIFPKDYPKIDGSKVDYIANFLYPEIWRNRHILDEGLTSESFRTMINAFKQVHGIGMFIANQAAVDLTYTEHLAGVPDIDTTWSPGPGTTKGIRWITQDFTLSGGSDKMNTALTRYREDLNDALSRHRLFSSDIEDMKTNIVPVSGPNASNSLCELSKHVWMALGKRDRMKNRYNGG